MNNVDFILRIKYNKNMNDDMNDEQKDMLNDLAALVAVPSVVSEPAPGAPFGVQNRRALDTFLARAAALGLRTGNDDGYAGWAEYGEGELVVGVLAHLDVVPAGENWTSPPFELTVKDGCICGRGVSDDKGPLVACLYALARLVREKRALHGRVRLIAGCNEEEGSACIKHYVSCCELPRVSFTPDSVFPVTASEKGILHAEILLPRCEDTAARLISLFGGVRPNVVPDFCRALVATSSAADSRYAALEENGVSAHGSTPEKGVNAITKLLPKLSALLPSDDGLKRAAELLCGKDAPARLGLGKSDVTGKTTVNVGLCSMKDGRISLTLDLRLPAAYPPPAAVKALRSALPGADVKVLHAASPLVHDENGALVRTLTEVYRRETGDLDAAPLHIGGGTYAKELPNCAAFGAVFPGVETHMHEADERYPLTDFMRLTDIYYDAIVSLDEAFGKTNGK